LRLILTLFIFLLFAFPALSQVERGGVPRSFQSQLIQKSGLQVVKIPSPDLLQLQKEDIEDARLEKPYRVGFEIPVSISMESAGQWDNIPGGRLWRIKLNCYEAQGLGLLFNNVHLPAGSDLFVYATDKKHILGAFTSNEIPDRKNFISRPVYGNEVVLEYFEPICVVEKAAIEISGLIYMYRGFDSNTPGTNKSVSSGSCEVNVNCEEGADWQNQKQGVVKILTKVGTKFFYCTGSLMNNTSQDFSNLLLSAAHCSNDFFGGHATDEDYSKWVFYFNYESVGCSNTGSQEYSVIGAEKLAIADNPSDVGSDFLLLRFLQDIPPKYNPYYCGWDAGVGNSTHGVGIHHPDGDIKKISTYTSSLGSGSWGSALNTHWIVNWVATENGHGVTEGGSSGSALFDDEGLVIGALTGGESSCANPSATDLYGKVSYSWESNGDLASQQLKPWLDPGNTGILKMPGSFNDNLTVADFSAENYVIPVNGTVNFQDLSSGKPDKWHWYFQAGKPAESFDQNPVGIRFESYGVKNVKLVVSNAFNSDSIVKEGFIDVQAVVSPNPCTGVVNILADVNNKNDIVIEVYDAVGMKAQEFIYSAGSTSTGYKIQLPYSGNVFIIKVIQGDQVQTHKVLVIK